MRRLFYALSFAIAFIGSYAQARIALVTVPPRENVRIRIDRNNNALVQENRLITVQEGVNRIEFGWQNMQVDNNAVQISPLNADNALEIRSLASSPSVPNTLVIEAVSKAATEVPLQITYLTGGLTWGCEYVAVADADEKTLSLEAKVTLSNNTVEDYEDAEVRLPVGEPLRVSIRSGETKKRTLFKTAGIVIKKTYTSDTAVGQYVAMRYEFPNVGEMLPEGMVRMFQQDAAGNIAFLGEDAIPYVPKGGTVRLYLGDARDIEIERKVVRRTQQNIKRNKQGNVVLYDTEENYAIVVNNRKGMEVPVVVRVHPNRDWDITASSDNFVRKDANTAEVTVSVPSGGKKDITFTVKGTNVQQGYVCEP